MDLLLVIVEEDAARVALVVWVVTSPVVVVYCLVLSVDGEAHHAWVLVPTLRVPFKHGLLPVARHSAILVQLQSTQLLPRLGVVGAGLDQVGPGILAKLVECLLLREEELLTLEVDTTRGVEHVGRVVDVVCDVLPLQPQGRLLAALGPLRTDPIGLALMLLDYLTRHYGALLLVG